VPTRLCQKWNGYCTDLAAARH